MGSVEVPEIITQNSGQQNALSVLRGHFEIDQVHRFGGLLITLRDLIFHHRIRR